MRLMEALCGCSPASRRLSAWLGEHPAAAAALMLLCALACMSADSWFA